MPGLATRVVPIVFCFDETYVVPAGVCITSLLANALETTSYEIHIICRDMTKESRERFARETDRYGGKHKLVFHDPGSVYGDCHTTVHFPIAMYYRFLIPVLFKDYEKVIYSDVDVLFLEDLSHLMDVEMGGNYLAAVSAKYVMHLLEPCLERENLSYLKDRYFASGFFVLDIKEADKDQFAARIDALVRSNRYEFPDNDALNIACFNKVTYLHLKYCVPPFVEELMELDINRGDGERMKMLKESIANPSIVHYLGYDKPWRGHVTTIYESCWWDYYRKSAWFSSWFFIKNGLYRKTRCQARSARRKLKKKIRRAVRRLTQSDAETSTR